MISKYFEKSRDENSSLVGKSPRKTKSTVIQAARVLIPRKMTKLSKFKHNDDKKKMMQK